MTPFVLAFVPMADDLLSAVDPVAGVLYIRDDATPEEVGRAVRTSELLTVSDTQQSVQ